MISSQKMGSVGAADGVRGGFFSYDESWQLKNSIK